MGVRTSFKEESNGKRQSAAETGATAAPQSGVAKKRSYAAKALATNPYYLPRSERDRTKYCRKAKHARRYRDASPSSFYIYTN